jgi:hypothetical protein
MYVTTMTMEDRLLAAKVAITNALADDEIKERLALLGYNEERLNAGNELLTKTEAQYQDQKDEYSEQFQASENMQQEWARIKISFRMYTTLARFLFRKDPTKMNTLGLSQGQAFKISDWILQARQFYNNAINDTEIQAKMAEYSVTSDRLQTALQEVVKLEEMKIIQEKEKGEAQRATQKRDELFAQLDEYMYGLIQIARVVLYDKEQLLEKMGIVAPSD